MQYLAAYMVWLSILALLTVNVFTLYFSVNKYMSFDKNHTYLEVMPNNTSMMRSSRMVDLNDNLIYDRFIQKSEIDDTKLTFDFKGALKDKLDSYLQNQTIWMVFCIILGVFLIIMSLIIFCLCRRINLAIAVIEEASK